MYSIGVKKVSRGLIILFEDFFFQVVENDLYKLFQIFCLLCLKFRNINKITH